MDWKAFEQSLESSKPPGGISQELAALWHDAKGNWELAHECVQDLSTRDAAWVHAYLHRKEGDEGNAAYWYSRGRKEFPASLTLEEEWGEIARELLLRTA